MVGRGLIGKYTSTITDDATHTEFEDMSMNNITVLSQPGMLGLRVVNMTGLPGAYRVDVDIPHVPRGTAQPLGEAPDPSGSFLVRFSAQNGFKLVKEETPSEKFAIDSIERAPTPN